MCHMLAPLLILLPLAACASTPEIVPAESAHAYGETVEVNNTANHPVVIKYYAQGGGPHYLGEVGPSQTQTFVLPRSDVGHILAETASGRRLDRETTSNPVRIRRVSAEQAP